MQLIGGITMTKAQEVRLRRQNSIKATQEDAQKIFELILEVLDKRTSKKDYSPLEVRISSYYIVAEAETYKMNYGSNFNVIANALKETIDREDGYSVELVEGKGTVRVRESILKVVIE